MTYLVLSKYKADILRGEYANGSKLNPYKLSATKYILPISVLDDADYAEAHQSLSACQTEDIEVTDEA